MTLMARGMEAHQRGRLAEAERLYLQALQTQPDLWDAQHLLGVLRSQQGRYKEALRLVGAVLKVKPNAVGVLTNYGLILHNMKRNEEALAILDRALAIYPNHALTLNIRGSVLCALGRNDAALASYNDALASNPQFIEAYNNIGSVFKSLGQFAKAEAALLKALELNPRIPSLYVNLADYKTFTAEDPHLAAMRALERDGSLSITDQMHLHFALGKAFVDLKDYGRAFEHLQQGNQLARAQYAYDETATLSWIERIRTVFTRDLVAAKAGLGDPSRVPIFIVGMPRSGTTLVEQILASHPDVHGGGELKILDDVVGSVHQKDGSSVPYPEFVASNEDQLLRSIGAIYVAKVQKLAPQVKHVIDKMPQNFLYAGLIHLVLPNSRIIHIIRDPVDTCISCFSTLFAGGQNYTYDLTELGRYYRHYHALMRHWHRVLPTARILDVRYEDIVNNLERAARLILTHCDLDWDPHCLEFYRTDRPIHTASARQVRKPIYKSSIGRWRVYEPYLAQLLTELDPADNRTDGNKNDAGNGIHRFG